MKESTWRAVEEVRREFKAEGKFPINVRGKEFARRITQKVGLSEWHEWVKEEYPEYWQELQERREKRRRRKERLPEAMLNFASYVSLGLSILAAILAVTAFAGVLVRLFAL